MSDLKRYTALWLLLAAALLAGCSSDDNTMASGENQSMEMRFDIMSEKLLAGDTRATIINNNTDLQTSGEDISITAYYHGTDQCMIDDAALRYNSIEGNWEFVDGSGNTIHYYWPIEGSVYKYLSLINVPYTSLDFMGFWPRTGTSYMSRSLERDASDNVLGPLLTCTNLPVTSAGQFGLKEYMCAYLPNQTYADQAAAAGGRLPLVFRHPLATVKFQLGSGHTSDVVITSITVPGIKNNGGYSFHTGNWSSDGDDANLVITGNPATGDTPYLVVPQTVGTKTITAEVTWEEWGVSQNHTLTTNVDFGTWQPGYIYTYTFTVNAHELIVNVTKFTEQW